MPCHPEAKRGMSSNYYGLHINFERSEKSCIPPFSLYKYPSSRQRRDLVFSSSKQKLLSKILNGKTNINRGGMIILRPAFICLFHRSTQRLFHFSSHLINIKLHSFSFHFSFSVFKRTGFFIIRIDHQLAFLVYITPIEIAVSSKAYGSQAF